MRTIRVKIEQLKFNDSVCEKTLIDSLNRQGQTFPIRVKMIADDLYQVLDGHKRASFFKYYKPDVMISCDVINDFTTAGSNYWGEKNHH